MKSEVLPFLTTSLSFYNTSRCMPSPSFSPGVFRRIVCSASSATVGAQQSAANEPVAPIHLAFVLRRWLVAGLIQAASARVALQQREVQFEQTSTERPCAAHP